MSVCLIVKNEASNLNNCLESVKSIADEIVVVDTGSTDGSQQIAQKFGAQVYEHRWQDDFALARNQSLAYAKSDWILVIDADETLDPESAGQIRTQLKRLQWARWAAQIINYREDENHYIYSVVRLFPRRPEIRYIQPFHEMLTDPSGQLPLKSANWLKIHHKGYLKSPLRHQKHKRNRRILKGLIAKEPQNPLWHIFIANDLYHHNHELALIWQHYQIVLRLAEQTPGFKNNPSYSSCVVEILLLCYKQKETQMGLNLAQSQQKWCQHLPEYWYNQGLLQRQNVDYKAAIKSFQACLQFKRDQLKLISYQVAHLKELPLIQIVLAYRGWIYHPSTSEPQKQVLRNSLQVAIATALQHQALSLEQGLVWLLETLSPTDKIEQYLSDEQIPAPAMQSARDVLCLLEAVQTGKMNQRQIFTQAEQGFQTEAKLTICLLLKSYAFHYNCSAALVLLSQLQQAAQEWEAAEQTLIEGLLFQPFDAALHQALKQINTI